MITGRGRKGPRELIGLMPAGGRGERINPLPCSKELFPVGFHEIKEGRKASPKVVSHYLMDKMQALGVKKAYVVLRPGKWDIPAYFGDGAIADLHIAYLIMNRPDGVPFTLDQAYPFLENHDVVFGFPDILFQPLNAFEALLSHRKVTEAEIVLGLFPADNPQKMDMVELDDDGQVRNIIIKPGKTDLHYTWIIAVWTPVFTNFMHDYLRSVTIKPDQELFLGDVILAAVKAGLYAQTISFTDGRYIDIGTPDDLAKAVEQRWV